MAAGPGGSNQEAQGGSPGLLASLSFWLSTYLELISSYYTDGQLATQEQGTQSNSYKLDPDRRTVETVATGHTTATFDNEYDGPGSTPAWLYYPVAGEWTRSIYGIAGTLDATQAQTETAELQLSDLHGDTIATVPNSETAKAITSALETTEYGVPNSAEPPAHSWLGASGLRTELPSGVVDMGARSYVPQLGRFLQPDPQPGGSGNAYAYVHGDPLNESDPSGAWSQEGTSGGLSAVGSGEGIHLEGGIGVAAGAVMPPPPNLQAEAAFAADPPWAGAEEYEEWEYEYAADHHGTKPARVAHIEPASLYQPLGEAEAQTPNEEESILGARIPITGPVCGTSSCKRERRKYHSHEGPSATCRAGRGSACVRGRSEGSPWEPVDAMCILVGWWVPDCWAYGAVRTVTTEK